MNELLLDRCMYAVDECRSEETSFFPPTHPPTHSPLTQLHASEGLIKNDKEETRSSPPTHPPTHLPTQHPHVQHLIQTTHPPTHPPSPSRQLTQLGASEGLIKNDKEERTRIQTALKAKRDEFSTSFTHPPTHPPSSHLVFSPSLLYPLTCSYLYPSPTHPPTHPPTHTAECLARLNAQRAAIDKIMDKENGGGEGGEEGEGGKKKKKGLIPTLYVYTSTHPPTHPLHKSPTALIPTTSFSIHPPTPTHSTSFEPPRSPLPN